MKDLIKMVKENNKLGYQLSAICGTNWLIRKLFKWQYLFFLMVMSAVCIKEIYLTLDVDTRILSALLYLVMLGAPFAKLRLGSEIIFMKLMIRNTFLAIIFTAALAKPIQERESLFWIFATIISFVVYRLANWLQTKLFHHYLFVRVLNKDYLGIRKCKDALPPEENLFTDANESDANQRMITINQRAVKSDYQDIVELSFLNREKQTGISYFRNAFGGAEIPLEREFVDMNEIYHPVFTIFPFGKKHDLYFKLVKFDVSKNSAFSMVTQFTIDKKIDKKIDNK